MSKLVSCDFEVFGKVQGVYFRKYTEKQAIILGMRGKFISDSFLCCLTVEFRRLVHEHYSEVS